MGRFIRVWKKRLEAGVLELSHGTREIEITVGFRPSYVFVVIEGEEIPVCHGNVNTATAEILDLGFRVVAQVESDSAVLAWVAVWDPYYVPEVGPDVSVRPDKPGRGGRD